MSFTRDYVITTPIDHTLNASWPDYDRRTKQDVQDRIKDIISGFNSGETVKGVLTFPFIAQSTPTPVVAQIQQYGKAVGGKTEMHFQDEDGHEIQATTVGKLNAAALSAVLPIALFDKIWPIGSVYTSVVSTNPNTLFGFGTWSAFATGRCLVGLDAGQTEFDVVEETGGEKTHTLTIPEMPAHDHTYDGRPTGAGSSPGSGSTQNAPTSTTSSTGGGAAHNNLQPYIVVYMWKRTA